ncbi:hypothetical protein Droror1_Dr00008441 [Drosera rotundifolia]
MDIKRDVRDELSILPIRLHRYPHVHCVGYPSHSIPMIVRGRRRRGRERKEMERRQEEKTEGKGELDGEGGGGEEAIGRRRKYMERDTKKGEARWFYFLLIWGQGFSQSERLGLVASKGTCCRVFGSVVCYGVVCLAALWVGGVVHFEVLRVDSVVRLAVLRVGGVIGLLIYKVCLV